MVIKQIKEEGFEKEISGKTVLIDFHATWCGPCKMLSPVLEKIKDIIDIIKIDIDECETLAMKYGVMSVPTLMIMKDGEAVAVSSGFMPEPVLRSWVEENM